MPVGVGLGEPDFQRQRKAGQQPKRAKGELRFSDIRANPREDVHFSSSSSLSTSSGVVVDPNACCQRGARYISAGFADVGSAIVLKKNRCPSVCCFSWVKACSVHSLRVWAIAFVWAKTAMESADVWKSASCWPVSRYVTRPITFCFQRVSTGKYR